MNTAAYRQLLLRLEQVRTLGVDLGLERMRAALARLGDPGSAFPSVQVAGTNGKGSTAAMTEAIVRATGLRTGLFTSPHLARFTERIRIDGAEVEGDALARLDARVVETGVPLTYFEVSAALAALAFAGPPAVEAAVLETGLGGRLDAVTAFPVVAAAITSIGLDHTDLLGPTLADVAREKAAIARPGVPLLIARLPAELDAVVAIAAERAGAPLLRAGEDFDDQPPSAPALAGPHQRANAALAVELARRLAAAAGRTLSRGAIERGLSGVVWPGRLERVAADVWLDAAHNAEGAQALARAWPGLAPDRPVVLVTSIVRGKDVASVLHALAPLVSRIVVTRSANPRALPVGELAALAGATGCPVDIEEIPGEALTAARAWAAARGGVVLVAGSIFLVGELRAALVGEAIDPVDGGDPLP